REVTQLPTWLRRGQAASSPPTGAREQGSAAGTRGGAARSSRPHFSVSRRGRWLILGTVVVAAGVLAWTFTQEPAGKTTARRPSLLQNALRTLRRKHDTGASTASGKTEVVAVAPPSAATYKPLLGHNLFQPLVYVHSRPPKPSGVITGLAPGIQGEQGWHGWKFSGVAQIGNDTYALLEG